MERDSHIHREDRPGRAATSNRTNRFEPLQHVGVDDGWGQADDLPVLRTFVTQERQRQVITRNASPDVPFDRSLNPYRGCEHGCIYCFARPTHAYLGLSPGLDFETRLISRPGSAEQLRRELLSPRYTPQPLAIGTNTDAYQPVERDARIMRAVLRVLLELKHPVTIVTKGALIERDIDLLGEMADLGLANVSISVTTLDPEVSRVMEPRVPAPKRRLAAIERLSAAGIPVRISASPIIPGLTDHELERIVKAGAEAGAHAASSIPLRLPGEVAELFFDWMAEHFPNQIGKVTRHLKEMHGGRVYDANWKTRMTGTGVYAELLQKRFHAARRRYGLQAALPKLQCDLFQGHGKSDDQLDLFGDNAG